MHDSVSPLRMFDEGPWLFHQVMQTQPFIRWSGVVLTELDLLLTLGLGYLRWQKDSH